MTSPRPVVVVLPAPRAAPEALFRAFPRAPAVLWAPPDGPALAGTGVAARIDVGRGGLREVRERGRSLLSRTLVLGAPEGAGVQPRLFGGVAFDPSTAGGDRWRGFGAGAFVLPRWTYLRNRSDAWLLLAVSHARELESPQLRAECTVVEQSLAVQSAARRAPARVDVRMRLEEANEFSRTLEAVLEGIARGRFSKVVLARRVELRATTSFDSEEALRRLARSQPGAWRFAMRLGGATFLGASPERLVRRFGQRVDADALAGSAPSGVHPRALRSSAKDLAEHGLVVRAIREALSPHCRTLSHPPRPSLRSLPGLRHLWTPIEGELRKATHVLDLVAALHPTPAVGGFPRAPALRFLRRHESPRGWYAGAFGWFDALGDGEFAVTIRSGLLRGKRADLWAGAGVVAGSTALAEIDEIDGKLATMLGALGVVRR